jgi:hypothetical protein
LGIPFGGSLWGFPLRVPFGGSLWVFPLGVPFGYSLWVFPLGVPFGCSLWIPISVPSESLDSLCIQSLIPNIFFVLGSEAAILFHSE